MRFHKLFKLLSIALVAIGTGGNALTQDGRPGLTIAGDNLWPTMDAVIGISTTGQRVYDCRM